MLVLIKKENHNRTMNLKLVRLDELVVVTVTLLELAGLTLITIIYFN